MHFYSWLCLDANLFWVGLYLFVGEGLCDEWVGCGCVLGHNDNLNGIMGMGLDDGGLVVLWFGGSRWVCW